MKLNRLLASFALVAGVASMGTANAAGVVFLLGTDAVGFHGDASYINPTFDQMANFGSKKLLFVNDYGAGGVNYTAGNITIDFMNTSTWNTGGSSGLTLASYSAVYFDSPSTCCSDPGPGLAAGTLGDLSAFVGAGGSLGVGDYAGEDFWDSILGFDGEAGVTGGGKGAITCEDPGVSTVGGLAFGYDPSYTEGCFVHQTYAAAFWAGKGFFALQTNGSVGSATFGDWVTMATGFADPGIPEPGSLALAGLALLGLAAARRRA